MCNDPYKQNSAYTEIGTRGDYLGQCRLLFNILEQWNGSQWMRVPNVVDRRPSTEPVKLHFGPEDFGT